MAEVVNLNKARKTKARTEARSKASENRVSFGRTKAEKAAAQLETDRVKRNHDGKARKPDVVEHREGGDRTTR